MFVLKPDGDSSSGNSQSKVKTIGKFFGKLGIYFVAIRAAHIFWGASDDVDSSSV
jgi:hypothetical protein